MSRRLKIVAGFVAVLAMMSASGLAFASSKGAASGPAVAPETATAALGLFQSPISSPAVTEGQAKLKGLVSDSDGIPLGQADYSQAHPVAITGSSATAWIVPDGEKVCTILVQSSSWGAGCATVAQVESGEALMVVAKRGGQQAIVVDVTPNGAAGPAVIGASGAQTTLAATSNVSAAVLPESDQIQTPAGVVSLAP
jgi:hypothetical protein